MRTKIRSGVLLLFFAAINQELLAMCPASGKGCEFVAVSVRLDPAAVLYHSFILIHGNWQSGRY